MRSLITMTNWPPPDSRRSGSLSRRSASIEETRECPDCRRVEWACICTEES